MRSRNLIVSRNTDGPDTRSASLGLDIDFADTPRDTLELTRRHYARQNGGLHVSISHNAEPLAYETAHHAADLFVAAPLMLDALENALEFLSRDYGGDPRGYGGPRLRLYWQIRGAISVAKKTEMNPARQKTDACMLEKN
jgi:hypothetical protein